MDIRWLQDFLIVAETGNFTRAAQLSKVSQAAFSRRIKTLEWWLGTVLIDRNANPLRLTASGEVFREQAAEIVAQIADARTAFGDTTLVRRQQIRTAFSYALASRLPTWWNAWSASLGPDTTCSVVTGSLQDSVNALMTGSVDLMVCHQSSDVPIALAEDDYDHVVIGVETLAPYAAASLAAQISTTFPGRKGAPIPLLMYSKGCLFSTVVDTILEDAPQRLFGRTVLKTQTPAVLRGMAVAGHGVAWLTACQAAEAAPGALRQIGGGAWTAHLDIVAYRDRASGHPALERLWAYLSRFATDGGTAPDATRRD